MAVRFRKGRASPWQCYWNNPFSGKRESQDFKTEIEAQKHDSLIKHKLRFERESFKKEDEEDHKQSVFTLQTVYLEYLKYKQFPKRNLVNHVHNMKLILERLGEKDVREISKQMILQSMQQDLARDVKPTTVRDRYVYLKTVLRFGVERGYLDSVDFPKLPPGNYEKLMPPTPQEIQAMLMMAPNHLQRIIILGSQCGVRVGRSELFRLKWQDVDFQRAVLRVHGSRKNKAAPWREVPINEHLQAIMHSWYEHDEKEGYTEYMISFRGKPVSFPYGTWRKTLKRAGITRRIRLYDLRHAFATEAIAGGADIGTVASIMGHANPTMILRHYQYVLDTQKRAAVEALPSFTYVPNAMCPMKYDMKNVIQKRHLAVQS